MKVILNKTTKIDGKFVMAGEAEVTKEQKKDLEEQGLIGGEQKNQSVMTDMEAQKLREKVKELEKGDDKALKEENKKHKAENEDLKKELVKLAGGKEENKGLLSKFGL